MARFGLALGGGGARGLAHIGVLKVLDAENIRVHAITGCSMGAVVGGLYAYFGNAQRVEKYILDIVENLLIHSMSYEKLIKVFNTTPKTVFEQFVDYIGIRIQAVRALNRISYIDEETTKKIFECIPDVPVESLAIPYSAIATDLLSGEEINFTKGNLREIVRASSAIPGIFPPVQYHTYYLVDGSASESVPAGKVRELGVDRVVGVDVTRSLKSATMPQNAYEVLYRTEDITIHHLSQLRMQEADLLIRPKVQAYQWTDFRHARTIINAGEEATRESLSAIRKLLKRNRFSLRVWYYAKKLGVNHTE
ncbi:MAG: patatin-like phospholipase family protein [Bacteroidetes bacterium]|nr:patatin-like phospholipase family protein [Bacteroidota bacterium]